MGIAPKAKKGSQYILFMLQAVGVLEPQKYENNYDEIVCYNPLTKTWDECEKSMLEEYVNNWKTFCDAEKMKYVRAFIIPNSDIQELDITQVYLSFGLKEFLTDDIKMVLSNTATKSENMVMIEDPIYLDACTPCPKVCGSNEP